MRTDEHAELAQAESVRAEANLSLLLRGLSSLSAGALAARESNAALSRELDALRELLSRAHAEEMALKHRVLMLEHALESTERDGARARAFFIEQEDAFLRELLADHESETRDLRRRLAEALERRLERSPLELPTPNMPPIELAGIKLRKVRLPTPKEHTHPTLPPRPDSRPPLRAKADLSTRPLVDYSLGEHEVVAERLEGPWRFGGPEET